MGQPELRPAYSSYAYLLAMLAQGWRIEPPVYVRHRWLSRSRLEKQDTYHFILKHGERSGLVSVFDCPEVKAFLETRELAIDRL